MMMSISMNCLRVYIHVHIWKAHSRAAQVYMCTWSSPPPLSVDDLCTAPAAYFSESVQVYMCLPPLVSDHPPALTWPRKPTNNL